MRIPTKKMPAPMPRPNLNRVRVSFHLGRDDKDAIEQLATERGEPKAETFRAMLAYARRKMPKGWKP